jgi:hypothetical protein
MESSAAMGDELLVDGNLEGRLRVRGSGHAYFP